MERTLYPVKFVPILKERMWGGTRLKTALGKKVRTARCGESWEVSGVAGDVSVVADGFLKGNTLQELIEVYMGDVVGEKVYDRFGIEFPVLVKFIDAADDLSIQVHPDDVLAAGRHGAYGKTEMWYVMDANEGSSLIAGFNRRVDRGEYVQAVEAGRLEELMNVEKVQEGDVFFIPAGRVHAAGRGILLAEIQQTSDVTYRIYDWNRTEADGKRRELHTELAVDAIDYSVYDDYRTRYGKPAQGSVELVRCPYFTVNFVCLERPLFKDCRALDSFVIYVCVAGACAMQWGTGESVHVRRGETVLVPAALEGLRFVPAESVELLEVYVG